MLCIFLREQVLPMSHVHKQMLMIMKDLCSHDALFQRLDMMPSD